MNGDDQMLLARVTEAYPGSDGLVRVVTLRTVASEFRGPLSKLTRLSVDDQVNQCLQAAKKEDAPP